MRDWRENVAAFVLNSGNSLAGANDLSRKIGWSEMTTWFGWPLFLAIVISMVVLWRASLTGRIATLTGLLFACMALGSDITIGEYKTGVPGPWALVEGLPLFSSMEPGRMAYALIGAAALLLAMLCDRLSAFPVREARLISHALLVATIVPAVALPLQSNPRTPAPHFFTSGAWQPYVKDGTTLVNLPLPSNYRGAGLEELGWQAQMRLAYAVPGGYGLFLTADGATSYRPPTRTFGSAAFSACTAKQPPPTLTEADREAAIGDLKYWRASVIVIWVKHQCGEAVRGYAQLVLRQSPQQVDDVWLWDVRQLTGVG